tara:strand:+ start:648 stop:2189 length:1542 start_codon:yes stop_codon:yes gene_type:complete
MNPQDNYILNKKTSPLVAAVDLGSNSFHLLIGRIEKTEKGLQIISIDSLKAPVKLANGLDEHKILDNESKSRAIKALERFSERLRSLSPDYVRVVATNTFRVAKNGKTLLKKCEESVGFPIEIISGVEEARLIYNGVCNSLNNDNSRRLVIDIGGGSTEFVIGYNSKPEILESIFIGCIKITNNFFIDNKFDKKFFSRAVFYARKEIQVISSKFKSKGWDVAYGCSGTVKSIHDVIISNSFCTSGITLESMELLVRKLVDIKSCDSKLVTGLKPERVGVFAGGLAILYAIFKELKVKKLELSNAALRLGVLYDIAGKGRDGDIRSLTIEKFIDLYNVDRLQIQRINQLAFNLWDQLQMDEKTEYSIMSEVLRCAVSLLEIGHSISHNGYHKHSSYIVSNSEMPGFSQGEQQLIAKIILGHVGKITKVIDMTYKEAYRSCLLSIRLAAIFSRSRTDLKPPKMLIKALEKKYTLYISETWLNSHPLTQYTLEQESREWSRLGIDFNFKPQKKFLK